jgi:hypothetical protein
MAQAGMRFEQMPHVVEAIHICTLSFYAKCIAPMQCLLEIKTDVHSAQCELVLHFHASFGPEFQ